MQYFSKIKNELKEKKNINSLLIAILCMAGLISFIIGKDNIIPIIEMIVLIIGEIVNYKETLQEIKQKKNKKYLTGIIFWGITILTFLISIIRLGFKETIIIRMLYFVGFICIPYMCCRHEISAKKIIDYILIISGIIAIPLFNIKLGYFDGGTRMSISYYMLPTFIAMVMTFFINENKTIKSNVIKGVVFLILFYPYMKFFIEHISRGAILAIGISILLCAIINKSAKTKVITIAVLVIIIIIIGVLCLRPILYFAQHIVDKINIKVELISKSLMLIEKGSIDNGRNEIYQKTINGIKENPIIGKGVGEFEYNYQTYPHNFLLQTWYEGGIVFFVANVFIFLYSIYILIFDNKTPVEKKYLLILFFSIAIIKLMLSYEFWKEISFGLYLYIVLDIMQKKLEIRRKKENGNNNNTNIQKSPIHK